MIKMYLMITLLSLLVSLAKTSVPVIEPPKSVVLDLPPTVAPIGDYDFGGQPPLPELPDKTYRVHHDPSYFPDAIFDRPKDEHKYRPIAKDIQPRPCGRWLHTLVELDNTILLYGGVIDAKKMLNDLWTYSPSKQLWQQKQRASLPMPVVPPDNKYKNNEEQGRPAFAPEPPEMRALPAEDNGAKTPMEMDPDGGEGPPDEMDADVSLPIYHTPWIPVINPEQPIAQAVKRRRRLLADIKSKKVLPNANALLRGKKEQDSDSIVSLHDFWEYNLASSSWLRLPPNEGRNNPMRRSLHGAVSIGTKMLIFGGVGTDNNVLMNDIWSYDIKTRQWEEIDVGSATNRPLPREGHAMIKGPFEESSSFTIHGGMGYGYVPYEDTWTFDLGTKQWSQIAVVENIENEWVPAGRWMHSAVSMLDEDQKKAMYIFGGCSKDYSSMEDLWKLVLAEDEKDAKWSRVEPIGFPPPARWLHTANVIQSDIRKGAHAMLIYAGSTSNSPLKDMWIFSPYDNSWVEVEAILDTPFAREGHSTTIIKPEAETKKLFRRRRRLLMDGPGDVHISTGAISDLPDVAIEGPNKLDIEKMKLDMGPGLVDSTSTTQLLFVFGGSSEPGLVSEIQDPSPI